MIFDPNALADRFAHWIGWGENPDWLTEPPEPVHEAEDIVQDVDDGLDLPPSPHRRDATTDAVERLLALHSFGTAPEGLQGPSKPVHRPFPRDTRSTQ